MASKPPKTKAAAESNSVLPRFYAFLLAFFCFFKAVLLQIFFQTRFLRAFFATAKTKFGFDNFAKGQKFATSFKTILATSLFLATFTQAEAASKLVLEGVRLAQDELTLRFNRAPSANEISFVAKNVNGYTKTYTLKATISPKLKQSFSFANTFSDKIDIYQNEKGLKVSFNNAYAIRIRGLTNGAAMRFWVYEPPRVAAKIVVDAGHGGKDGGTTDGGVLEKTVALKVALKVGEKLQKRGYNVIYTRKKDVFLGLDKRAKIANQNNADLFISIHINAVAQKSRKAVANGIETYFLSRKDSSRSKAAVNIENKNYVKALDKAMKNNFFSLFSHEKIVASNKLAIDIQREMLYSVKQRHKVSDGGVREGPFYVLASVNMPAVLIELGYITHPQERKLLKTNAYLELLAEGITNGVDEYFKKSSQ